MDVRPIWVQTARSPHPLPSSDHLQAGNQMPTKVSKHAVHRRHNIEPPGASSVRSQYRHTRGTGTPAAPWGGCTGSSVLRTRQAPATSLCRAEAQEIRSSGHKEVCTRMRSSFHMLNFWSQPSAEPSRCLRICGYSSRGGGGGGGGCKGRCQLPAHKRRHSLLDTEVGKFWFAAENAKRAVLWTGLDPSSATGRAGSLCF